MATSSERDTGNGGLYALLIVIVGLILFGIYMFANGGWNGQPNQTDIHIQQEAPPPAPFNPNQPDINIRQEAPQQAPAQPEASVVP